MRSRRCLLRANCVVTGCISCFGADRCMFESNFPVDRWSLSYAVLWNAFKKIAARYSQPDQDALLHDNALRVYQTSICESVPGILDEDHNRQRVGCFC